MEQDAMADGAQDDAKAPGLLAWAEDEEFLMQAGMEFLIALGVHEVRVQGLPRLRELLRQSEALEAEITGSHEPPSDQAGDADAHDAEDATPAGGMTVDDMTPEQRERFNGLVDEAAPLALPIAGQVLDRLEERGIRTAIVGYRAAELRAMLADAQDLYDSGRWRDAEESTLSEYVGWIAERHDAHVTPVAPEGREIRAIVTVLRAMPKATIRRIAKMRNRLYLGVLVRFLLRTARSDSSSGDGTSGSGTPVE